MPAATKKTFTPNKQTFPHTHYLLQKMLPLFLILGGALPANEAATIVTTAIHMVYPLPREETLIILEEGSVWIEDHQGVPSVLDTWDSGDLIQINNPYEPSENEHLLANISKDAHCSLVRVGKTTKIPYSISAIAPYDDVFGTSSVLTLNDCGTWVLIYDREDLHTDNSAIGWNPGERVLLIVDPDEDWSHYPNTAGIFKYWWDYYFLNLDQCRMIDPVAIPYSHHQTQ